MCTEDFVLDHSSNRHPLKCFVDGIVNTRPVDRTESSAALLRKPVLLVYTGVLVIAADQKHFGRVAHFKAEQQSNHLMVD